MLLNPQHSSFCTSHQTNLRSQIRHRTSFVLCVGECCVCVFVCMVDDRTSPISISDDISSLSPNSLKKQYLELFTGTNTKKTIKFAKSIGETFTLALIIVQDTFIQKSSCCTLPVSINCTVNPNC